MGDVERSAFALRGRTRAEMFTWQHTIDQHVKAYEMAAGQ
jgi:hypothetical protein